jgi:hypothetical protein
MLDFFKRLMGMPTKQESEVAAQSASKVETPSAPYKVPEPAATTPIPLGTEGIAPIVAQVAPAKKVTKARAPAKPKVEVKPKAEAKPKAAARTAKPKISVAK